MTFSLARAKTRPAQGLRLAQFSWEDPTDAIWLSGFWRQGDWACFEDYWSHAKGANARTQDDAPTDATLHVIADRLHAIGMRNFYQLATAVQPDLPTADRRCRGDGGRIAARFGSLVLPPASGWIRPPHLGSGHREPIHSHRGWAAVRVSTLLSKKFPERTIEMYVKSAYMMDSKTGGDHAWFPRHHALD